MVYILFALQRIPGHGADEQRVQGLLRRGPRHRRCVPVVPLSPLLVIPGRVRGGEGKSGRDRSRGREGMGELPPLLVLPPCPWLWCCGVDHHAASRCSPLRFLSAPFLPSRPPIPSLSRSISPPLSIPPSHSPSLAVSALLSVHMDSFPFPLPATSTKEGADHVTCVLHCIRACCMAASTLPCKACPLFSA
jgi:hypothetical protein